MTVAKCIFANALRIYAPALSGLDGFYLSKSVHYWRSEDCYFVIEDFIKMVIPAHFTNYQRLDRHTVRRFQPRPHSQRTVPTKEWAIDVFDINQ